MQDTILEDFPMREFAFYGSLSVISLLNTVFGVLNTLSAYYDYNQYQVWLWSAITFCAATALVSASVTALIKLKKAKEG